MQEPFRRELPVWSNMALHSHIEKRTTTDVTSDGAWFVVTFLQRRFITAYEEHTQRQRYMTAHQSIRTRPSHTWRQNDPPVHRQTPYKWPLPRSWVCSRPTSGTGSMARACGGRYDVLASRKVESALQWTLAFRVRQFSTSHSRRAI